MAGSAGWTIRAAEPGDQGAIDEVYLEAAIRAWGDFVGAERIATASRGVHRRADLVAVDAEGVLGFVAWDASTGEIERLYIHPRAQGRGAGSALLDRALQALRDGGRDEAWLHTEQRSAGARRFYERRGWRPEGPPRVRDWHGVHLVEPRYARRLDAAAPSSEA